MSISGSNRRWSLAWLVLAVLVVPFLLARFFFEENQLVIGVALALVGLLIWLATQGMGVRGVDKDTVVIVRDSMTNSVTAHAKGSFFYNPLAHTIVASMPSYPLDIEFPVENIDTRTPGIARITKITVRATCTITNPEAFYRKSTIFLERIKELEETSKLKRTDPAMWRQIAKEVARGLMDDTVRDVVWKWEDLRTRDSSLKTTLNFESLKNSDDDPYGLSLNRANLAAQVTADIGAKITREGLGIALRPIVFESIEIDPDLIKRKTGSRAKDREKAVHEAAMVADGIRERGLAEAEVRATTLARLLDVLINQYKIPYTDPLVAQVVRAALYADGEMLWTGVLERGTNGAAEPKDKKA